MLFDKFDIILLLVEFSLRKYSIGSSRNFVSSLLFSLSLTDCLLINYIKSWQDDACRINSKWRGFFLQQNIFEVITQIRSNNKRPDLKNIHSYLVRIEKLKEVSVQYLQQLILQLEDEGKVVNKKFKGADLVFITETKATVDPLPT